MFRVLFCALLAAGCQGAVSSPTKQNPHAVSDQAGLEAKVDKLQATLDALIESKERETNALVEYEACQDRCAQDFPWESVRGLDEKSPELKIFSDERDACFDRCSKMRPPGTLEC